MNIDISHRSVSKISPKTRGRYAWDMLWLDTKRAPRKGDTGRGALLATDGRIAVAVPCELGDEDADGFVTREALDAATKSPICGTAHVSANGSLKLADGRSFPRPAQDAHTFPAVFAVLDALPAVGAPGTVSVTLNAAFLDALADAMGGNGKINPGVTLTFEAVPTKGGALVCGNGAIRVTASAAPDAVGGLMPIAIDDERLKRAT